jgi:CheY-like chemotaxis protein
MLGWLLPPGPPQPGIAMKLRSALLRASDEDFFPTRPDPREATRTKQILQMPLPAGSAGRAAGDGSPVITDPRQERAARILLVSADEKLRSLMRSFLEHAGFEVVICGDAARSADALSTGLETDLLVVDLHLLGTCGLELALSATARRPGLLVVALLGPDAGTDLVRSLEQRGWRFLVKPFQVPDLLGMVSSAVDSLRSRRVIDGRRPAATAGQALPLRASNAKRALLPRATRASAPARLGDEDGE